LIDGPAFVSGAAAARRLLVDNPALDNIVVVNCCLVMVLLRLVGFVIVIDWRSNGTGRGYLIKGKCRQSFLSPLGLFYPLTCMDGISMV
jgi:hypothetical protein